MFETEMERDGSVGKLYSVQYKRIFGVPDKVSRNMRDKARPMSQVWGVEPNIS